MIQWLSRRSKRLPDASRNGGTPESPEEWNAPPPHSYAVRLQLGKHPNFPAVAAHCQRWMMARHKSAGSSAYFLNSRPGGGETWSLEVQTDGLRFPDRIRVDLEQVTGPKLALAAEVRRWDARVDPQTPCTLPPHPSSFHPPRLVRSLIERFGAFRDKDVLLTARTCDDSNAGSLLLYLQDPRRTMPVLLVSPVLGSRMVARVPQLATTLAGLCHVYVLSDDRVAATFTRLIGTHLGCYGGAVRLYRPALLASDDDSRHPLWLPSDVLSEGRAFARLPLLEIVDEANLSERPREVSHEAHT